MGQIRQIGGVYYIEFYARGLMYSQVAGSSLETAQKLLEATEAKIAQGEALTVVREIDLSAFFERCLNEIAAQFSPKTVGRFKQTIRHFNAFLQKHYPGLTKLSQITPIVVETYKADLTASHKPKIVNFSILLLREILEYGITISFINDNPTLHVRLLQTQHPSFHRETARYQLARDLFAKGVSLRKAAQLLKLSDIARIMYYANLIPLSREDMYNVPL